jgi:hypothetical protein
VNKLQITKNEQKSILLYLTLVIFGLMFITSLNKLYMNDWFSGISPKLIFIASVAGIIIVYYVMDLD